MNILKLLLEDQSTEDTRKLIEAIAKASPFFEKRADDNRWMYRGMNVEMIPQDGFVRTYTTRTDRKPKDSNATLSDVLDKRLHQDFGVPYRSASLFVTGQKWEAQDYGAVGIILPQGDFKFCYGRRCKDAYKVFNIAHAYDYMMDRGGEDTPGIELLKRSVRTRNSEDAFIDVVWDNHELKTLFYEWFDYTYQNCEYTDEDLNFGLSGDREVMVACNEYVVIPASKTVAYWHIDEAETLLDESLQFRDRSSVSIHEFISALSKKVHHY